MKSSNLQRKTFAAPNGLKLWAAVIFTTLLALVPSRVSGQGTLDAAPSSLTFEEQLLPNQAEDIFASGGAKPVEAPAGNVAEPKSFQLVSETPGSIFFPQTKTTIKIGGYFKLDSIFDFDDAGNRFLFDTNSIPVGCQRGEQLTIHARQSRLNIDAMTPTELGDLHLFCEGDFFGDGSQLRMRHAYGELGGLLAGQTWILAVDDQAIPETLDFYGPEGAALFRRPQVRLTLQPTDAITFATSVHDPIDSINTTAAGEQRGRVPVFVSSVRFQGEQGHLYIAAGLGENRFVPDAGRSSTAFGWGNTISFMKPFGDDKLIVQGGVSEGFTEFLPGSGTETSLIGELEALFSYGYVIAWQHHWTDSLRSNWTYRSAIVSNSTYQPTDALHRHSYNAVNLIWSPLKSRSVDIGAEYLWGRRENKDGHSASAHRLQLSVTWRLP
ncbi:MAG: DcaP family trimeric outer membrane transporter [Planctomycetaceae bacterium]